MHLCWDVTLFTDDAIQKRATTFFCYGFLTPPTQTAFISRISFPSSTLTISSSSTLTLFTHFLNSSTFSLSTPYFSYSGAGSDPGGRVLRLSSNDARKGKVRWPGGAIWEEDVYSALRERNVRCACAGCYPG